MIEQRLPESWGCNLPEFSAEEPMATRSASNQVINALAQNVPTLLGGSADLATSSNTLMKEKGDFSADERMGRNIWFGVREHAMGAIANGMAVYGGVFPFTGTFLIFSDYIRPALRIGALMGASSPCFYP